ncbi:hypothetical protein H4S02_003481 [Coemansia sp. RSA 2611]|nr:hypothetical protein H4S01_003297 [Coemansia sp. RSA 2610]KAJ2387195.1 hypothetical protein H4S02_003481 [Coemansia sp. RSA 2611]
MKLLHVFAAALAVCAAGGGQARAETTVRYSDELEAKSAAKSKQAVPKSDAVVELDKHTYLDLLKTRDSLLIEFYATWCAACHGLSSEFSAFAEAARKQFPDVVVARADINAVEYLSSSFMVSMLPELVFIHRPMPGATPEVRYVSANFTQSDLLAYIGGRWTEDKPSGSYASLWCTPTNLCGHVGGLLGELVVNVDQRFNPFDIPPWSFMAIVVSVLYLVGQIGVGFLSRSLRRWYHKSITQDAHEVGAKPVYYDEYRSDTKATPTKSTAKKSQPGSATKRAKGKRSKKD